MKNLILLFTAGFLFHFSNLNAQIQTPAPSPSAKVKQTVGLTEVTIEYSRPSVKGRTIFAHDGLVPFGDMWRTGANAATKLTFSDDVTLAGKKLAAGSYALVTTPTANEWSFHFYPHETDNFGAYLEKEPTLTVMAVPVTLPDPIMIESFTIGIGNLRNDSAEITFLWERTWVSLELGVNVHEKVMANIESILSGPSTNDYYTAGSYLHSTGKDLETALKYVQKATHSEQPRFWQVRTEALILADLGKYKEAIKAAEKSKMLAKEAGNDDYIRNNEKSISAWTAKVQ